MNWMQHERSQYDLRRLVAVRALIVAGLMVSPLVAQAPIAVSPGSPDRVEALAGSCPTFSWSPGDDAIGYELAVYRVFETGGLKSEFQVQVRGARAGSWTPSSEQCLTTQAQYAWTVRALSENNTGPWSDLMLFATPGAPTDDEVRLALGVLRRRHQAAASREVSEVPAIGPKLPKPEALPSADPDSNPRSPLADAPGTQPDGEGVPGVVSAPASFSLALDGDLLLSGALFRGAEPLLHADGTQNVAVGWGAMVSLSSGIENSAVGDFALRSTTSGSANTAVGTSSLLSNTSGFWNTAIGRLSMADNTTGHSNTAIGGDSLRYNTTGFSNTATGTTALLFNTTGSFNTAIGGGAMLANTTGQRNTAIGDGALRENTTGSFNTASGRWALQWNTTGQHNTGTGARALQYNTTGARNAASGFEALRANTTGFNNVAVGYRALFSNSNGARNTGVGHQAMPANTSGALNTAIGYRAGYDWTTGSSNIAIGHGTIGVAGESGAIRIGGGNNQTKTFIEGISATNVTGVNVLITAGDQLGIAASSARFKRDIHDLEGVSDRLEDLRPVSFRYKEEYASGGLGSLEYGLIAEEVAEVLPELVVFDEDGRPYTVRYNLLTPLLLAEVQRLQAEVGRVNTMEQELAALRKELETHRASKERSKQ